MTASLRRSIGCSLHARLRKAAEADRRMMGDFATIAIERAVEEVEAAIATKEADKPTRQDRRETALGVRQARAADPGAVSLLHDAMEKAPDLGVATPNDDPELRVGSAADHWRA